MRGDAGLPSEGILHLAGSVSVIETHNFTSTTPFEPKGGEF